VSKWTQEKWAVNPVCAQVDALPSKLPICQLLWPTSDRSESETEANAFLIAAAPRIAKALEPFAKFACDEPCDCHNCEARAALAAARGDYEDC